MSGTKRLEPVPEKQALQDEHDGLAVAIDSYAPADRDPDWVALKYRRDEIAAELGAWHVLHSDGEVGRHG
jgi:hypothetical protein